MNQKQIRAAVEAMLFASGDPIGADKLAQAVQLPQLSVEAALEALRERYAREDSGLCLLHLNTPFCGCSAFLLWPTCRRCTGRKRKRTHHRQKVRGNAWEHSSPRWAQCCCSSSG